jgi:hypothetical protein
MYPYVLPAHSFVVHASQLPGESGGSERQTAEQGAAPNDCPARPSGASRVFRGAVIGELGRWAHMDKFRHNSVYYYPPYIGNMGNHFSCREYSRHCSSIRANPAYRGIQENLPY